MCIIKKIETKYHLYYLNFYIFRVNYMKLSKLLSPLILLAVLISFGCEKKAMINFIGGTSTREHCGHLES